MRRVPFRPTAAARWGWGMLFASWAVPARALTLEESVRAVEEVDPDAVVAELQAARGHAEVVAAVSTAVGSVGLASDAPFPALRPWDTDVIARVTLADPVRVLAAVERVAAARTLDAVHDATRFEAGYAAARLYVDAVAAEADLEATRLGEARARATLDATGARVEAGLEAGLSARSARLGLLEAEAARVRAEAARTVARERLARALQRPLPPDEALAPVTLPWAELRAPAASGTAEGSPWLTVGRAAVGEARAGELRAWGGLLPRTTLRARRAWRHDAPWQLDLDVRWDLPGGIAPLSRVRARALGRRIADVRLDGLTRDLTLAGRVAEEEARAAAAELTVAEARASLAEETLAVGQSRLGAGLVGPLEVLRIQDDAARARRARVEAERRAWQARLQAARVDGRTWSWGVAEGGPAPSFSCGETPCVPR